MSICAPAIFGPVSFTTYTPEYRPAPVMRTRVPAGSIARSAAIVPRDVTSPLAVVPVTE